MKAFFLAMLAALLPFAAFAAPAVQLGVDADQVVLTINLDRGTPLANHLVDVLVKSPLVHEETNMYVKPKTFYKGDGFSLMLQDPESGGVTLRIQTASRPGESIIANGKYASARTQAGGFRNLHQALLESRSAYAFTHSNPGKISPQDGEVSVLETDHFYGQFLSCGFLFGSPKLSVCSIQL